MNLEKLATKVFDVMKIMAKLREFVRAGMSGAESVTAGLGLVWDSTPLPMMLATAPNLPRPAIARLQ